MHTAPSSDREDCDDLFQLMINSKRVKMTPRKKATSNFWFAVRRAERTEYFMNSFTKSSKLGGVLDSVAIRFAVEAKLFYLSHKGKILVDRKKSLLDYSVNEGETIAFYDRQGFTTSESTEFTEDAHQIRPFQISSSPQPSPQPENALILGPEIGDDTVCNTCGSGETDNENIFCEDCHNWWHWKCFNPPLRELPDGDWYCASCTNDIEVVIRPDNEATKKHKAQSKRKPGDTLSNLVPETHRGHVPGIECGQSWRYRKQCRQDLIHRPLVAGIHGSVPNGGAVSICMNGGYDSDIDRGDWFLYTGCGGFPDNQTSASGKQKQITDQKLESYNLALAVTCDAKVDKNGAVAKDWRKSLEIRVVRGYQGRSDFSPKEGFRYDGLYKLVRYYLFTPPNSEYTRYMFEFRRDDNTPMPWTVEGKANIQQLGLAMVERGQALPPKFLAESGEQGSSAQWEIPANIKVAITKAISTVPSHERILAPILAERFAGKYKFVKYIRENVLCTICHGFVDHPITNPCGHIACLDCIKTWAQQSEYGLKCSLCKASLLASAWSSGFGNSEWAKQIAIQTFLDVVKVDETLVKVLRLCMSTYCEDIKIDMSEDLDLLTDSLGAENKNISHTGASTSKQEVYVQTTQNGNVEVAEETWGLLGFKEQEALHFTEHLGLEHSPMGHTSVGPGFREQQALHYSQHVDPAHYFQGSPPKKSKRTINHVEDAENLVPCNEDHVNLDSYRPRSRQKKFEL